MRRPSTFLLPLAAAAALVCATAASADSVANGMELNGTELNGVDMNNVRLAGAVLRDVKLVGTQFVGARPDGAIMSGKDFVGAIFVGFTAANTPVQVRIDGMEKDDSQPDVWRYEVSYHEVGLTTWRPICWSSGAVTSVPVSGLWDYGQGTPTGGSKLRDPSLVTFACAGAAIAKCIDFGYAPWRSVGATSLDPYHQACTRLVRADYCGDGTPHTQEGRTIHVYDGLGIERRTEDWRVEAEWGEDGAICMTGDPTRASSPVSCPGVKVSSSCGKDSRLSTTGSGTLQITELP